MRAQSRCAAWPTSPLQKGERRPSEAAKRKAHWSGSSGTVFRLVAVTLMLRKNLAICDLGFLPRSVYDSENVDPCCEECTILEMSDFLNIIVILHFLMIRA